MLRFLKTVMVLVMAGLTLSTEAVAQTNGQLSFGDPPVAALINVSPPDAKGMVTISGANGSVFPTAQVAIRNLYTDDTVYVQAGITGAFSASIYGPGNTPFWISPADNFPNSVRQQPGALPGGPGTIVYGSFSEITAPTTPITQLLTDGSLSDWDQYPNAVLSSTVYALVNLDSLHVGIATPPINYTSISLIFTLDGAVYSLLLDPRVQQPGSLRRLQPNETDLGMLSVPASQAEAIELRIPLTISPINPTVQAATLEQIQFLSAEGTELSAITVQQPVALVNEKDGPVHPNSLLGEDFTRFTISGSVGQGAAHWTAQGRVNSLNLKPGDQVVMELDVTLDAPDLPQGLMGLQMLGRLDLQPLAGPDGNQAVGGLHSNNGWSNVLTPSGMGISNLSGDVLLGIVETPAPQIIRQGQQLLFSLNFALTLPEDLPAGMYVPAFYGFAQISDGEPFAWHSNSLFASGKGISRLPLARTPLIFNVGGVADAHLVWTLFQDDPSDGSRGILANEDRTRYALANRVHFDSPTYILPYTPSSEERRTYSLEPYLLNQLSNAADTVVAPLIPFLFPGGRLSAQITRPDGEVDNLGSAAILQNCLSTTTQDDRTIFGANSQIDVYRLTTLNPLFTDYSFNQYGSYKIALSGNLEDVWGNRYQGGGDYTVLVAEMLDLIPAVLPGTPFVTGNAFNLALHISPGAPAEVTITLRIYPLDDGPVIEQTVQGKANRYGYFYGNPIPLDVPGEYVADYEVRYTDAEGRLWAASQRSAGVIAAPESTLVAHGRRGMDDFITDLRPAWFNVQQYLTGQTIQANRLNYPYHSGDVAWVNDGPAGQIRPIIQLQDTTGVYANWLVNAASNMPVHDNLSMQQAAVEGELPVQKVGDAPYNPTFGPEQTVNDAYYYISAVRPDVTLSQFIAGGQDGLVPRIGWDDPANQQIGTGMTGNRVGDYVFLFGGAVVRNQETNFRDAAIYGAVAMTIDPQQDQLGPRVYPPFRGEAGGPNGGPLMVLNGEEINQFFHPTGVRPGDVLTVGDTLAVAGQFAPALPSVLSVTITSPSGAIRQFEGQANPIGYFYQPVNDFAVDEVGIWLVEIHTRHEGLTSAGRIESPVPVGTILGAANGQFMVYVLPSETESLEWNDTRLDISIPASFPYNFTFALPEGWVDIQVFHTITTPSYLLEQGPLRIGGTAFSYQYNPSNLSRTFPNLENNGEGAGPASSDVIRLTFVVTGHDENGRFQIRSRTFTIMHDRLTTLE